MVSSTSIEKGIASYLDNELMPKLPLEGIKRVALGTAVGVIIKRAGFMLENLKDNQMLLAFGIVDGQGGFDLELLQQEAKKQISDAGFNIDIPLIGSITFKKEDVDLLYNHILRNN